MRLATATLRNLLAAAVVGVLGVLAPGPQAEVADAAARPNVILILADDLDQELFQHSSLDGPWNSQGMRFNNALVTTSLCCPSRASILRGQYSHNTHLTQNLNSHPHGGARYFRRSGLDRQTLATLLRGGGYTTWFGGKYLNGYEDAGGSSGYVPPGWSHWEAYLKGKAANVDGRRISFKQHPTDWLSQEAVHFIQGQQRSSRPFYMQIAPFDVHAEPKRIPERHRDAYQNARLPTPPSFNEADVSDKPPWIQNLPRISESKKRQYTTTYRKRLQSTLTLKDLCRRVVGALSRTHELDNTYLIFTTDNGFVMGIHRIKQGKNTPYNEAHEVPFVVRGPHVPKGSSTDRLAANIDIAPTALDLANIRTPRWMDGRSLVPLLDGTSPSWWRTSLLIEGNFGPQPSYAGVRSRSSVYVRYATGEKEYYDLVHDPYQLRSKPAAAPKAIKNQLQRLKSCSGAACRRADRL
jgi:N-acetylglucosamine-6-sulfatase